MADLEDDFVLVDDNSVDSDDDFKPESKATTSQPAATPTTTVLAPSLPPQSPLQGIYQCEFPEIRTGDSITHRNIQTQAFCGWLTFILRKAESESALPATDLCSVFTNAHQLNVIISSLTGTKLSGLVEAHSAYDKIMNLELAMDAFAQVFPLATSVSASSIASNNQKVALDFAWVLFYYSSLQPIAYCGLQDRFALLLWAQHIASNFANTPSIKDFTNSFSDGIAIGAIIETKLPGSLDVSNMSPITKQANLRRDFEVAEKHFNIPKLLSPTDVTSHAPDDISMILYLTLLYQHCKV